MNILIINHYAGSPEMGMEFRPYYFAREWIKMGHKVDIIAGDYSHLRQKNPVVHKDFQKEKIDGITYHWVKTILYEHNGIRRAYTMFQFVGKLFFYAKKVAKKLKPDVVIASSTYPLDTYAAQRIAKKAGAKLIHEVHDMWPISPMEINGMSKNHPFIVAMQIAENSFCKNSDRVVSLLPAAKKYFMKHGMKEDKFFHVSNGIVLEDWNCEGVLPESYERKLIELREKDKFILCFFGSILKTYALENLIDSVKKIKDNSVVVVFVGNGMDRIELEKRAGKEDERFVFLPPISKKIIPVLLKRVDAIFIGMNNKIVAQFGICMNKLFDSMMSGKPILYAVDAPNNYIDDYHCGITVEADNILALYEGILKMKSIAPLEREKMGLRGKNAVVKYFNYQVLSKKFEQILMDVL